MHAEREFRQQWGKMFREQRSDALKMEY